LNNVNYGNYLALGGHLNDSGSAVAVALLTHISDTGGVFGAGGVDLNPLILAASGAPNFQALGDPLGANPNGNAGIFINGAGDFVGLAINNIDPVNIPNNDVITVSSTLTVIGDPASIDNNFFLSNTFIPLDQLNANWPNSTDATGLLPDVVFTSANSPEPTSIGLLLLAAGGLLMRRRF
jgi:hypothetical protein